MKFICAALLGLMVTNALAGDDDKTTYSKELGTAMIAASCDAMVEPASTVDADGSVSRVYEASNEVLHSCQFINEVSASGCIKAENCPGYEDWTRDNPDISPALPREAFLYALEARKSEENEMDETP